MYIKQQIVNEALNIKISPCFTALLLYFVKCLRLNLAVIFKWCDWLYERVGAVVSRYRAARTTE